MSAGSAISIVIGALVVAGLALIPRRARATADASSSSSDPSPASVLREAWLPPAAAAPYVDAIAKAEDDNGIPRGLLGRLLYQESRFRADIINGAVKSSAGAVGIAQIVPRYHPAVDPLDPFASIAYAGRYLAQLKAQFATWDKALAAYNWGPGNLGQAIASRGSAWIESAPAETVAYVRDITRDTGVA